MVVAIAVTTVARAELFSCKEPRINIDRMERRATQWGAFGPSTVACQARQQKNVASQLACRKLEAM